MSDPLYLSDYDRTLIQDLTAALNRHADTVEKLAEAVEKPKEIPGGPRRLRD